jgi:uncharacterized membrane-anchored protein
MCRTLFLADACSYDNQKRDGGFGLGTAVTSAIFLVAILLTVVFLTRAKKDVLD